MGLAETQKALVRLYTDTKFREQFFAEPAVVGCSLGLDEEEALGLASANRDQVEFFADSLRRKRLGAVRSLLPITRKAMGIRFGDLFMKFSEAFVPCGIKKHEADAVAFTRFLNEAGIDWEIPWIPALAAYEADWLEASQPGSRWISKRYAWPVGHLAAAVNQGKELGHPVEGCYAGFWWRLNTRAAPGHVIFKIPFKKLRLLKHPRTTEF
ncbi:MAG: hypothetical protein O3B01_00435 [Planctomycetota bacterium]|nr:hypothetical protein [Planctomycetota bacterium]MDA1137020.1 hypothetical protein [Planctomycetota bacterium]